MMMIRPAHFAFPALMLAAAVVLYASGCGGSYENGNGDGEPQARWIYAVTADGQLTRFWMTDLGSPWQMDTVEDLDRAGGERVVAMADSLGANAMMFLTSGNRLLFSAGAPVETFTPALTLAGSCIGLATLGPGNARVLAVSEAGERVVLTYYAPTSAAALPAFTFRAGDPNAGATPHLVAVTRVSDGTIYGVDTNLDVLVRNDPGTDDLVTVGSLGVDADCSTCLDDKAGTGYLSISPPSGQPTLYSVDLGSGQATPIGYLGVSAPVVAISINGHLFPPI